MLEREECSPETTAASKEESLIRLDMFPMTMKKKKKNKRRFSDEQIKSLESMFESESKLEPRKKLQIARDLGLQPRQIAIWFQNRRARWKSKQLERDYSILKANYDSLASRFESMKKEKQSLMIQLQKLSDMLGGGSARNNTDGDLDKGNIKCESEQKPSLSLEGSDLRVVTSSNDEKSKNVAYFEQEEERNLMNMAEPADGVLTSPENWCSFDSSGLFDQSCSSSQWWEFWS